MRRWIVALFALALLVSGVVVRVQAQSAPVIRMLYFWAVDCAHCHVVQEEVLEPLLAQHGARLDVRMLEVGAPENYELLVRTEEYFDVPPETRGLPTLVIGGQVLIGEDEIRRELPCLVESCLAASGTTWPDIPGLQAVLEAGTDAPLLPGGPGVGPGEVVEPCPDTEPICVAEATIWVAYFYQTGCPECSRAEIDIAYVRSQYPQLVIDRFNVYDDAPLAQWMAERVGRATDVHPPALFIGDDALIGEREITPQNLTALMARYASTGADRFWDGVDVSERIHLPGVLTVVGAGLVDGLNPCAFATLIFFVSYLAASGRKGRDVLLAGAAFTLGVFGAYLAVGLGFYRVLDVVQTELPFARSLNRWVYGVTAVLCIALAVLSFRDYLKARKGEVDDMALSLPERLRNRVRAVIRSGQRARSYVGAMFVTGVIVSLLELACTGQIYLPTIIYMTTTPGLRSLGTLLLVLYNLAFILPLVVVFVLTYFGTSSYQLGLFFKQRTATVKLVTGFVFTALAVWLVMALV